MPQASVVLLTKELELTAPTIRAGLEHLESLGILREVTGSIRQKVYVYKEYLDLLLDGTESMPK